MILKAFEFRILNSYFKYSYLFSIQRHKKARLGGLFNVWRKPDCGEHDYPHREAWRYVKSAPMALKQRSAFQCPSSTYRWNF